MTWYTFIVEEPRLNKANANISNIDQATLIPKSQWERMQYSLAKSAIEEQRKAATKLERDALHQSSKGIVKHWSNTIEVSHKIILH